MNNINLQNTTVGADFSFPGMLSLGQLTDVEELSKTVATFLGASLHVTTAPKTAEGPDGVQKKAETPSLDTPDANLMTEANLEGLVALLKLTLDKTQADLAKKMIKNDQGRIDKAASDRMEKINKNLKDMDKAAAQARARKALGWLGAIFAVVVAIVSVVTCGAAASVLPIVTAALAVTMQTLEETGAMEKMMKGLADWMQKEFGWSKAKAQCMAGIFFAVAMIALTAAGMGALAKFAGDVSMVVKVVSMVGQGLLGVANAGVTIQSAIDQQEASKNQAEMKDIEKLLLALRRKLEESQDGLENILKMLEDGFMNLMQFVDSKFESEMTIAMKMKAMA